ncbi:hypothetical protein J2Y79_003377 [Bacillus velezensis]|nr:hypothetical protein [Bacillus amyloliquefaciens]MCP1534522.1 hypothetical protein [Bacillus velezensis]MCP1565085.1 hypothetical protein [Bacillus velezensis]QIR32141.1 hypothetical protein BVELS4_00862 [Bacillus velezensis]
MPYLMMKENEHFLINLMNETATLSQQSILLVLDQDYRIVTLYKLL